MAFRVRRARTAHGPDLATRLVDHDTYSAHLTLTAHRTPRACQESTK